MHYVCFLYLYCADYFVTEIIMKNLFLVIITLISLACQTSKKESMSKKITYEHTNMLIYESSPYLLQHAHNPVNWLPWGKDALIKAQKSKKLLIISIGYAACHWCHVMAHESFEDTTVAKLMNDHYVSVKVDREEHPDVDKIYMSAVQMLNGKGGWPLNVVALPDGRPVWGGVYFSKAQWMQALEQIADIWQKNPDKLYQVAKRLEQGIIAEQFIKPNSNTLPFSINTIHQALNFWKQHRDNKYGGLNRVPKFPMPSQYNFLLRAGYQLADQDILNFVQLTLDKMSQGGIYDQVDGGFARYSTDLKWHIPHFEKMLYDNALLVSLYSDAYKIFQNASYSTIVDETLEFVQNELTDANGAFYSSIDADSSNKAGELEEGAYYVFTKEELKKYIGDDYPLFKEYFNINQYGLWQKNKYHLIKRMSDQDFIKIYNIDLPDLKQKAKIWRQKLQNIRRYRDRPRLDDKTLTSWNALMLNAYVDAYKTFNKAAYLSVARKNADFLLQNQIKSDGGLYHSYKQGKSSIEGYLEDYAFLIKALINLYEASGITTYLKQAEKLNTYTLQNFYDQKSGLFYFTHHSKNDLITRPMEVNDNVIPSSNAVMAENLFKLGHYLEKQDLIEKSHKMLQNILPKINHNPLRYYYWLNNTLNYLMPFYEIAITGPDAYNKAHQIFRYYLPNKILAFALQPNDLPLLKNRFIIDKTYLYLCVDNTCQLPVTQVEEIIKKIKVKL